ncbi:cupin domain-containing protein [Paenibacillus ginsengarvi]|uniref:Cupin domain-containing protein n=1 Tax=Paenibacillus ginsengarvi TaxID=400777 RepID=A0A3B0C405_9BACL|nr:cupin domain-containing protein [Paenibacillus ginsengarvi]RKN79241.1 cupin domain-containing protein [Paenibacillus ginsengarvi]
MTFRTTKVNEASALSWIRFAEHDRVQFKEIVRAEEADELGIGLSSVLWEKIEVGGAVLPHYHDVAEIIHITVGQVRLLCNGEWKSFKAGDTFLVPAGSVHSVRNDDSIPTEQVSIFIPVAEQPPSNTFFATHPVEIVTEE